MFDPVNKPSCTVEHLLRAAHEGLNSTVAEDTTTRSPAGPPHLAADHSAVTVLSGRGYPPASTRSTLAPCRRHTSRLWPDFRSISPDGHFLPPVAANHEPVSPHGPNRDWPASTTRCATGSAKRSPVWRRSKVQSNPPQRGVFDTTGARGSARGLDENGSESPARIDPALPPVPARNGIDESAPFRDILNKSFPGHAASADSRHVG